MTAEDVDDAEHLSDVAFSPMAEPGMSTNRTPEQQAQWRDGLVAELVRRAGTGDSRRVVLGARAAAALDCLMAAMEEWVATDGSKPLDGLVDLAFSGLNTSTALKARDEQADPCL